MDSISSLDSFSPSIFLRMDLTESGFWQYMTETSSPSAMPHLAARALGTSMVPLSTSVSDLLTKATTDFPADMVTRSFSFTPISAQSSSCIRTTGSDTSMSYAFAMSFI